MPCNYVTRYSVELKAADFDLLKKAVEGLGYEVTTLYYNHGRGRQAADIFGFFYEYNHLVRVYRDKIEVQVGDEAIIDKVKQAYSKEVIKAAAKKYGWTLKSLGQNKLKAKRGF